MSQHSFEYVPDAATVFTRKHLCSCDECILLTFFSRLKESWEANMDEREAEKNITIKTELEAENECELDQDTDRAVSISEFTDISLQLLYFL